MLSGFVQGPYRLSRRFVAYRWLGAIVCLLFGVACIVGYGSMANTNVQGILHDQRVWSAGGEDIPASFEGNVTTRQFVLKSYALTVEYEEPPGHRRQHKIDIDTLFGGLEEDAHPIVRVAPGAPDDFALGPVVHASGVRWASAGFFAVVGIVLLGGACFFFFFAALGQLRRVRRAARNGEARLCPLLHREAVLSRGRPTGTEIFRFKVPGVTSSHPSVEAKYQFRTKGPGPLLRGEFVVAIVPPDAPEEAILLLADYYPLEFSEEERRTADAAIAVLPS